MQQRQCLGRVDTLVVRLPNRNLDLSFASGHAIDAHESAVPDRAMSQERLKAFKRQSVGRGREDDHFPDVDTREPIGNRCCRSEPLDGTKLAADLRQAALEKTTEQERYEESDDS